MSDSIDARFVLGAVVAHQEWRPGLRSLFVTAPINPFIAGQFTQLALDEEQHLIRPYSFVNPPSQPILEFYYSVVSGGKFSTKLSRLLPGEPLFVARRPMGRFTLANVPAANNLWLFASGTGLGVFLSILQTQEPWQRFQHIILVHSVQKAFSLTHTAQIQQWQEMFPKQFHWLPIVTGEYHSNRFSLRVTDLLKNGQLEYATGLQISPQHSQAMLCGNPAMIQDVCTLLLQRGLTLNQGLQSGNITLENYWKLPK